MSSFLIRAATGYQGIGRFISSRQSWAHVRCFAGHSKWQNIRHKKAANDKKRAKVFTKIIREIEHAMRNGGNTPDNLLLQGARAKANQFNLPKEKIEQTIKRAESNKEKSGQMEVVTYEATGPKGVALLVEALSDNRNRTAKELRHIVTKHNGSLDSKVMWNFKRYGDIRVPRDLPGGSSDTSLGECTWGFVPTSYLHCVATWSDRSFDDLFDEAVVRAARDDCLRDAAVFIFNTEWILCRNCLDG